MNNKLIAFSVNAGTYEYDINFIITADKKKAAKFVNFKLESNFTEDNFEGARGRYFISSGKCPIIWLPEIPKTPRQHGTLSHEIFHVVVAIMDWANIRLCSESEEAWTHLIGHITTKFYEKCK